MEYLNRQKKVELAALCNRLFLELTSIRHHMLLSEKMKAWRTPLLTERGPIYWSIIDRLNITILAMTLSKVIEVYKGNGVSP